MYLKSLTLAAAVLAMSALAANAQSSSSNPTMAPTASGTSKVEAPGKMARKTKKHHRKMKAPNPGNSSSNPSMAPAGAGSKGKTENLGKSSTSGPAQKPDSPASSSSTPSMAPTK